MTRFLLVLVLVLAVALGALACDSSGGADSLDTGAPPEDAGNLVPDIGAPGPDAAATDLVVAPDLVLLPDLPIVLDVAADLPPAVDVPAWADTVDGYTGATPQGQIVDEAHTGWKDPRCWDCHVADDHSMAFDPYGCTDCHGRNGAQDGHGETANCLDCHDADQHGAEGFPGPLSCRVCHPN